MERSDFLSLIAIEISVLSLLITLYFQFLKFPKLKVVFGDILKMHYDEKGKIYIFCNLTFFNLGARYRGINKIVGKIYNDQTGDIAQFRWNDFYKTKNIAKPGEKMKIWNEYEGDVETIVIPGYQAVNKSIVFLTNKTINLQPGKYYLEFDFSSIPSYRWGKSIKYKHEFILTKDNIDFLNKRGRPGKTGVVKALTLRLE